MNKRQIRNEIYAEIIALKIELKEKNRAIREFKLSNMDNTWDFLKLLRERDELIAKKQALESTFDKVKERRK